MAGVDCDVAVAGGGQAGLAAALTLLRYTRRRVTVVESSEYDGFRIGETASPGLQPMLVYLGAWETFLADRHRPALGTSAAWGRPELSSRDFLFTGRGNGWHLDRCRFDATLASQATAIDGVHMHLHHTLNCLVGPSDSRFDAKQINPCAGSGSGAIPDEPDAAKGLKIESRLNGNVMQSDNTDNMMFPVVEMLVYITQGITLEPGDVIFTGTPSGVGHARKPNPVWMKSGDTIEVEIQGVGTLSNPIADE